MEPIVSGLTNMAAFRTGVNPLTEEDELKGFKIPKNEGLKPIQQKIVTQEVLSNYLGLRIQVESMRDDIEKAIRDGWQVESGFIVAFIEDYNAARPDWKRFSFDQIGKDKCQMYIDSIGKKMSTRLIIKATSPNPRTAG